MKRFQFRQESLLRIRKQLGRQAEMRLIQARVRLGAAQQQKSELLKDLDQLHAAAWNASTPYGLAFWQWQKSAAYLNHSIKTIELQIDELAKVVAQCAEELRQRTMEIEALDALRVRQWRKHQDEMAISRQQVLDEVAMGQWFQTQHLSEEESEHG